MNYFLNGYFEEKTRFPELAANPLYLGHVSEMGWILNEAILNREKENGLYLPTIDWKRRGEISVAMIMSYMNIIYCHHDNFLKSDSWKVLLRNTLIAAVTQFWQYKPFKHVTAAGSIELMNSLFEVTESGFDDQQKLASKMGVAAAKLENEESDAMILFSGYTQGLLYETFM